MTDVKEVPASNAQISGVLFGIANDDGCFGGITHRILRQTINISCSHNYLRDEKLCNKWQDCTCYYVNIVSVIQCSVIIEEYRLQTAITDQSQLSTLERNVIWQHILLPACHA